MTVWCCFYFKYKNLQINASWFTLTGIFIQSFLVQGGQVTQKVLNGLVLCELVANNLITTQLRN